MREFIHFSGIVLKFLLINTRVFMQFLFQTRKSATMDFSDIDTIVFTHNLGGGTLSYENQNFYKKNILIVRLVSYRNDYFFCLENEAISCVVSAKRLFKILTTFSPKVVIVNSLCAYSKPEKILDFICKNFSSSFNRYLVHDHHCVCSRNNAVLLMNEKYCGLECKNCKLKKESEKWCAMWKKYFSVVDEVVCFSNSSKKILLSVYSILNEKIKVIPHSMDYCKFTPLNLQNVCNIAVVGNCSNIPKGKNIIKKLVKAIKKAKKRKLYIVGKSPFFFYKNSRFVKYTGKYDLNDLPEILKSGQIGVIVFTSIWPETFSYAISELMKLNVYIVSLNLGAQGEKLTNYSKAIFVENLESKTILAGVEKCFTL